ncbi:hypothetical protein [Streptomyces sp. AC512_CC834]|uniref:hypothetical protein n=1 Tax=Streptomyces sp. AC512_CC834 TaxID=2823691 RepID=UPI0027E41BC4|nr:hypothetical protein [Streptomyces sp. AC512_CC834]
MAALVKTAPRLDIPIVTSALTTLEIRVVHTDDQVIAMARDMLRATGLHGHKYAIDAVLAAVAGREAAQGAQATVFTSDTDDMDQLLAGRSVRVEKV